MRLIDADALLRIAEDIEKYAETIPNNQAQISGMAHITQLIYEAPTIDAEPVVHCRECRYFRKDWWHKRGGVIVVHEVCKFWGHGCKTKENSYCSNGERKEE